MSGFRIAYRSLTMASRVTPLCAATARRNGIERAEPQWMVVRDYPAMSRRGSLEDNVTANLVHHPVQPFPAKDIGEMGAGDAAR